MNLSSGGVGYSFGRRGYRVSTGPRGTFVCIGAGGIRYRTRIDGPAHKVNPPFINPAVQGVAGSVYSRETIRSAHVSQLRDSASNATLDELNAQLSKPRYTWLTVVAATLITALLGAINPIIFLICIAASTYAVFQTSKADKLRRTYTLFYEMDDQSHERWTLITNAVMQLGSVQRLWSVRTIDHTYDWKHNAGANQLITRTVVSIFNRQPPYIATNVRPQSLVTGDQTLFFYA